MRYLNILVAIAAEPWALEETKLLQVAGFLKGQALGAKFTAEEIEARIGRVQERQVAQSDGQIAIVPIYGVMCQRMNLIDDFSGGTSTEQTAAQFRMALADPGVKAILLDLDTPGGATSGTGELADEIYNSRGVKPIIAQINSCAASAGYWVASAADEIVVTPGGQGGSIGVYTIHDDISKMLEKEGVTSIIIRSGEFKIEANEIEPLTADIRARVQRRVDLAGMRFTNAVARNRGIEVAAVNDRFGRGLMFDADELLKRGMADRVVTLPETLERFGLTINPVARANRERTLARAEETAVVSQAAVDLVKKLKAGGQFSRREIEHGFKGLVAAVGETLSNSEAEAAVMLLQKPSRGGRVKAQTASIVTAMQEKLGDTLQILERRA